MIEFFLCPLLELPYILLIACYILATLIIGCCIWSDAVDDTLVSRLGGFPVTAVGADRCMWVTFVGT